LTEGGAHTGWSRAWLICLYARLQDGEECLEHLGKMLASSTLPNLFSNHPPMQIDGNFGACAGILEMLVQSHETEKVSDGFGRTRRVIRILPACPRSWLEHGGCLEGVRCRSGFELRIVWRGIVDMRSTVQSHGREEAIIILPDRTRIGVPWQEGSWTLSELVRESVNPSDSDGLRDCIETGRNAQVSRSNGALEHGKSQCPAHRSV
jgi:hypothetical protein